MNGFRRIERGGCARVTSGNVKIPERLVILPGGVYTKSMIRIVHPSRLARQDFFQALIPYLQEHEEVTLRQIKRDFPEEGQVDKRLESYIQAGYIKRENRRYTLGLPLLESLENLQQDQETFVDDQTDLYHALEKVTYEEVLGNQTNQVRIREHVSFLRNDLSLASYFYQVRHQYPLTAQQQALFQILGDVNVEYALKYLTTFLLKFTRKDRVIQRRSDIFVDSLVLLGYIEPVDEVGYRLTMTMDPDTLTFTAPKNDSFV